MSTACKSGIVIGMLAEIVGIVLLVPPAYFLMQYFTETASPTRHELMLGFGLAIIPPTIALGLAGILAVVCRRALSPAAFLSMLVPGIIMAIVTVVVLLMPMTFAIFERTINQAIEPTETRGAVPETAAQVSLVLSGLHGSAARSAAIIGRPLPVGQE